mgnify:CR=1 FL=1
MGSLSFWEIVLTALDGRKAKILAVAGIVIGLASLKGWIDSDISVAILSILNIVAGGAAVGTNSVLGKRNFEGRRVPKQNI